MELLDSKDEGATFRQNVSKYLPVCTKWRFKKTWIFIKCTEVIYVIFSYILMNAHL